MIRRLLVGLAFVATIIGVAAVPAYAAYECSPNPRLCVYDFIDGTGPSYYWTEGSMPPGYGCVNLGGAWNDRVGSAYNRSSNKYVWFYRSANCLDPINPNNVVDVPPGAKVSFPGIMLNQASSFFYAYCPYTPSC